MKERKKSLSKQVSVIKVMNRNYVPTEVEKKKINLKLSTFVSESIG